MEGYGGSESVRDQRSRGGEKARWVGWRDPLEERSAGGMKGLAAGMRKRTKTLGRMIVLFS